MKMLSWLVAIFVLAVLLALSARFNTAYVQIVYAPWRVELSLSFAVVVVTIGFFLIDAGSKPAGAQPGAGTRIRVTPIIMMQK